MSESNALYRDTVKSRLLKFVIWAVVFTLVRLLLNNAIGMIIDKKSVIASTQTSIPKAGTVAAEFSSVPFLVVLGEVAAKWIYPVAMAAALVFMGWKLAGWIPFAGYAVASSVYYSVGVQDLKTGLNGLTYFILIPIAGIIIALVIQALYNKSKAGNYFAQLVEPCIDSKKGIELAKAAAEAEAAAKVAAEGESKAADEANEADSTTTGA